MFLEFLDLKLQALFPSPSSFLFLPVLISSLPRHSQPAPTELRRGAQPGNTSAGCEGKESGARVLEAERPGELGSEPGGNGLLLLSGAPQQAVLCLSKCHTRRQQGLALLQNPAESVSGTFSFSPQNTPRQLNTQTISLI